MTFQAIAAWGAVMIFGWLTFHYGILPGFDQAISSIATALLFLVLFLIGYGYYFFCEWLMRGQTPGKYLLGLRVVQTSGLPVTLWPALVRNLLRILDFLPVLYGVGTMVALTNSTNRRVGDLAAGTVVARERRKEGRYVLDIGAAADAVMAGAAEPVYTGATGQQLQSPAHFPSLTGDPTPQAAVAVASPANSVDAHVAAWRLRLSEQDYELVQEFLQRRATLPPQTRARLGQSLTQRLWYKLGEPLPAAYAVEPFLETIAQALQRAP